MATPDFGSGRGKRVLTVVGIAIILIGSIVGGRAAYRAWALHRVAVANASLRRCLLGSPLRPGEHASGRVHKIALAGGAEGWPARCDQYGSELERALEDAGQESLAAHIRASVKVDALDVGRIQQSPYDIDAFFDQSPSDVAASVDVVAAPEPAEVADERTAALVPRGSLLGARVDPDGSAELQLLVGGDSGRHLCTFAPAFASARCQRLPPHVPSGPIDLMSSDGGGPALVDVRSYSWGAKQIYRGDDWKLLGNGATEAQGLARDDGTVTLIEREAKGDRYAYFAVQDGPHARNGRLDLGWTLPRATEPRLLGDRLLWLDDSASRPHLMLRRLAPDRTLGAVEDAGELPFDDARFWVCRTGQGLTVLASRAPDYAVTFRSLSGGSALLRFSMPEEAKERSVDGPDVLACGENDVSLTQRRTVSRRRADFDNTGFVLHSARCTKEKCRVSTVHVDEMLAASSSEDRPDGIGDKDVVAGVLDGRLLVVWRSSHHGVRFRLSAPDALSRAKDGVLYDDRVQNGQVFAMSLIQPNFRLVIRRNAALVLLETMDSSNQGTKAIRILPDGSTSVVHVIR